MYKITEQWIDVVSKKYHTVVISDPSQIPETLPEGYVRIQYDSSKIKLEQIQQLASEEVKFIDNSSTEVNIRTLVPFLATEQPDALLKKYIELSGNDKENETALLSGLKEITSEILTT